jgi:hypothetical protein
MMLSDEAVVGELGNSEDLGRVVDNPQIPRSRSEQVFADDWTSVVKGLYNETPSDSDAVRAFHPIPSRVATMLIPPDKKDMNDESSTPVHRASSPPTNDHHSPYPSSRTIGRRSSLDPLLPPPYATSPPQPQPPPGPRQSTDRRFLAAAWRAVGLLFVAAAIGWLLAAPWMGRVGRHARPSRKSPAHDGDWDPEWVSLPFCCSGGSFGRQDNEPSPLLTGLDHPSPSQRNVTTLLRHLHHALLPLRLRLHMVNSHDPLPPSPRGAVLSRTRRLHERASRGVCRAAGKERHEQR